MKRTIACLLCLALALTAFAACGKKGGSTVPNGAAEIAASVKTIGEAMGLAGDGNTQYAISDKYFVYVLDKDGAYLRFTAALTGEQADALWELDMGDDDYDEKLKDIVSDIAVTKFENLTELMLTEEEIKALIGKTGEDLMNDGFDPCSGYNLDTMEFYMERTPFSYTVTFEAEEPLENNDDFDEYEAIRPLKVKAVEFTGLGDTATDIEEETNDTDDEPEETGPDYLVLVNKQNKLPEDWESVIELEDATNTIPEGVELSEENGYLATDVFRVEKKALEAFRALQADLEQNGIIILLDSTYRSVARQEELWQEFEEKYGLEYTQNTVAEPGTSEHHTGLAIDVCIIKDGAVINENADMIEEREIFSEIHAKLADYGFILRFPEGGKEITGYDYEPWHFRYVGVEAAQEIAEQGVTLEEYLGTVPEAAA